MKDLLGPRFAAFAMDYIVVDVLCFVHAMYFGTPSAEGGYQLVGLPALVAPGIWFTWLVLPEWLWGATLGKKILGLRVQKIDGGRLGFDGALLRRICDVFDFWMSFGLVATICHLKTAKGQRVGDMAAGAIVTLTKKAPNQLLSQCRPSGAGPQLERSAGER